MLRSFTLASVVVYAVAQSTSLSSQCTTALLNVAGNADASKCLNIGALTSIATSPDASVVGPISTWVTSMCSAQACSNDTLASVVTTITAGCQTDLASSGLTADNAGSLIPIVQAYYPTVRQILCLKDGDTNCLAQTLTNLEGVTGTLSVNKLESLISNPPQDLPSNVTCTNCIKAAYNIIKGTAPSLVSDVSSTAQTQCGASFLDGTTPSGISQSASTSISAASNSGALPAAFFSAPLAGLGTSGVVVISTIFSFLA